MSQLYVGSEIGQLKRVILNRPEQTLSSLTPDNCHELLFDDVLAIDQANAEHDQFTRTLEGQGVEVLLLEDLLTETLTVPDAKKWLLSNQISNYRYGPMISRSLRSYLDAQDNKFIAKKLLAGMTFDDFPISVNSILSDFPTRSDFLIDPLPNHLFTRDASCWVYNGVSLNPMKKSSRKRETLNFRAIYHWHPIFAQQDFHNYFFDDSAYFDHSTIEGGDVLILGHGAVLIGLSERTSVQGIENLAYRLFQTHQANKIIVVNLPHDRSCMHLDTVMTHMDYDLFSIYPKIINKDLPTWEITPGKENALSIKANCNFFESIENILKTPLRFITTGGDRYESAREQWNDANNVLTVKPGTIITYERNVYTNEKYDKAGLNILTIPGTELGRGRGGARCMSCPIEREGL